MQLQQNKQTSNTATQSGVADPPFITSGYTSDCDLHLMRLALRDTTSHYETASDGREALSDTERERLALTARHGGLSIPIPTTTTFTSSLPAHR